MQSGLQIGGLSLVTIFGIASLAAIGLFLYYTSQWNETGNDLADVIRAELSYCSLDDDYRYAWICYH